jgi:hypothetical protein
VPLVAGGRSGARVRRMAIDHGMRKWDSRRVSRLHSSLEAAPPNTPERSESSDPIKRSHDEAVYTSFETQLVPNPRGHPSLDVGRFVHDERGRFAVDMEILHRRGT